MPDTRKSPKSTTRKASKVFTEEERGAMTERAREQKRPRGAEADGETDLLEKVAEMSEPDRTLAERIHAIVKSSAPDLSSTTWYGMPAYAKAGKIVCHFQPAQKFKTRYATLGFSDKAKLDEGNFWPVAFALKEVNAADEARIGALVKRAAS